MLSYVGVGLKVELLFVCKLICFVIGDLLEGGEIDGGVVVWVIVEVYLVVLLFFVIGDGDVYVVKVVVDVLGKFVRNFGGLEFIFIVKGVGVGLFKDMVF